MAAGRLDEPRQAAQTARAELGLDARAPISDALQAVEGSFDVPVAILDMGEGIAGAYLVRRGRPFILLNGRDYPFRRRFTLAHELGHHRLGHAAVVDGVETVHGTTTDPREQQASFFAGEFLAPATALEAWMDENGDPNLTINTLVHLAGEFGISVPAAYVRLCQADILIRPDQRQRLKRAIDSGQHRGAQEALGIEPLADSLTRISAKDLPRLPTAMRDNALVAYKAGLLSAEQLARMLDRTISETERMLEQLGIVQTPADEW